MIGLLCDNYIHQEGLFFGIDVWIIQGFPNEIYLWTIPRVHDTKDSFVQLQTDSGDRQDYLSRAMGMKRTQDRYLYNQQADMPTCLPDWQLIMYTCSYTYCFTYWCIGNGCHDVTPSALWELATILMATQHLREGFCRLHSQPTSTVRK